MRASGIQSLENVEIMRWAVQTAAAGPCDRALQSHCWLVSYDRSEIWQFKRCARAYLWSRKPVGILRKSASACSILRTGAVNSSAPCSLSSVCGNGQPIARATPESLNATGPVSSLRTFAIIAQNRTPRGD